MPGYKVKVSGSVKPEYLCPHCKFILKEAIQTHDGIRLCQSCYEEQEKNESGKAIDPKKGFNPDRAVRKDILELLVMCDYHGCGCPWEGQLKNWKEHCLNCRFKQMNCPNDGCDVMLPMSKLGKHVDECPFREVKCEYCEAAAPHNELKSHHDHCLKYPLECERCLKQVPRNNMELHHCYSCPTEECALCSKLVSRDTTEEIPSTNLPGRPLTYVSPDHEVQLSSESHQMHLASPKSTFRHTQMLALQQREQSREIKLMKSHLERVEREVREGKDMLALFQSILNDSKFTTDQLLTRLGNLEGQYEPLMQESESRKSVTVKQRLQEKVDELMRKVAKQDTAIMQQSTQIAELNKTVDSLNVSAKTAFPRKRHETTGFSTKYHDTHSSYGYQDDGSDTTLQLERKVQELERQTSLLKVHVSELELQLQASLASSHSGTFLWRIPDVARRRRDAIEERISSIYSPPFYTARNGYKMCIRAYLHGDGIGYKTHLSLFFVLMKGEYDPLLKWPFDNKVSIILVDQNHRKHVVQTFKPTAESTSFQRPRSDMNVASGCPQFAKLSVLDDENYVKDDVMYVKCIVDISRIYHP